MNNSFQNKPLETFDIVDKMCGNLGKKCKTKVRSILGVEVEHELIDNGLLCDLLHGRLIITEHTSRYDPFSSYDCQAEYNGQKCYLEVKGTFSKLGAYAQGRNIIDTLVMNNVQRAALQQLNDAGELVLIVCYYYLDDTILIINFRGTEKLGSTSDIDDAKGEKTFYGFEAAAVVKRIDHVMSKTFRPKIRTLQYKQIEKHNILCSSDRCGVKKHSI